MTFGGYLIYKESLKNEDICCYSCYVCGECCEDCKICCETLNRALCLYESSCKKCCKCENWEKYRFR